MDQKMTVNEMGAKGGRSRSEKKMAAIAKNIIKARAVRNEKLRNKARSAIA
jgi:hypothetical protein